MILSQQSAPALLSITIIGMTTACGGQSTQATPGGNSPLQASAGAPGAAPATSGGAGALGEGGMASTPPAESPAAAGNAAVAVSPPANEGTPPGIQPPAAVPPGAGVPQGTGGTATEPGVAGANAGGQTAQPGMPPAAGMGGQMAQAGMAPVGGMGGQTAQAGMPSAAGMGGQMAQGGTPSGGMGGQMAQAGMPSGGGASGMPPGAETAPNYPMTGCDGETSGLSADKIYYTSPTGSGDGSSFASAMSFNDALGAVSAGEMILLKPGTYTIPMVSSSKRNTIVLSKAGKAGAPITMVAANCGRAKFDFSYPADEWQPGDGKSFGFQLTGNYWYIKNIDVTRAGYHGIYIGGETTDSSKGQHNTIENCAFYDNRNTGLEINKGGAHNTVINTDSYENYDFKKRDAKTTNGESAGGMADGFASKQAQGAGNKFFGCRAWGNSDDGFDTYANSDPVVIEYSWAFKNGINIWGDKLWSDMGVVFEGNANGFKIGGSNAAQKNRLVGNVAFGNPANGFDLNSNTAGQTIYNNIGYQNGKNYDFDTGGSGTHKFANNISLDGDSGDTLTNVDSTTDSWSGGLSVSAADFASLDLSLAVAKRNPDGSLPDNDLFRLKAGSALINAGTDVGVPFQGSAPDLGPFESQ